MSDNPIYDKLVNKKVEEVSGNPTETPNKVIPNPDARRGINNMLSAIGIVLGTVMVIDMASDAFDISAWTDPAFAGYAFLAGIFGVSVIRPNIPR